MFELVDFVNNLWNSCFSIYSIEVFLSLYCMSKIYHNMFQPTTEPTAVPTAIPTTEPSAVPSVEVDFYNTLGSFASIVV